MTGGGFFVDIRPRNVAKTPRKTDSMSPVSFSLLFAALSVLASLRETVVDALDALQVEMIQGTAFLVRRTGKRH